MTFNLRTGDGIGCFYNNGNCSLRISIKAYKAKS